MPWNRPLIIGLLAILLLLVWWHSRPDQGPLRRTLFLMGTTVEVVATAEDRDLLETAISAALDEMVRLDKLLSSYQETSDTSQINGLNLRVEVARETAEVVSLAQQIAQASSGAFNPVLGRLNALWDIGGDSPTVPSRQDIQAALAIADPSGLRLDNHVVHKKKAELQVDLGGVAKGYIVDRAIEVLRQHGIQSAAVNAGGDMFLLGRNGERPWRIGIQHPRQTQAVLATLALEDRAVVTSGDYERFFEQDGVRYHHLFDPQTGYPARACQSVTVIADSVAMADALATALFVLGPERGFRLLGEFPGSEALIISADGEIHDSSGWADFLAAP